MVKHITRHAWKVSHEYCQFAIKFCGTGPGIHSKDFERNSGPSPYLSIKSTCIEPRDKATYAKIFRNLVSNSIRNCVMAL